MKKLIMLIIAALLLVPTTMYAGKSELEKARAKEYKTKMKELKKGKWELFGSSRSLDVALLSHYDKLNKAGENAHEVVGIASRFKSKNVGHQTAVNSAAINYANSAGSTVKGLAGSEISNDADNTAAEMDKFYSAYKRKVEKEIKGEMEESFSVIRQIPGSSDEYEMQTFFIINESAAHKARMRAYEDALKESEAAQKYAQKLCDFIDKNVDPTTSDD